MSGENKKGLNRRDVIAMAAASGGALVATACTTTADTGSVQVVAAPDSMPLGPDNIAPLELTSDYEALRLERMASLDDQMRGIYEQMAGSPPFRQMGVEQARGFMAMRKGPLPEGVTAHNISIPGPAGDIPARVFRPEGVTEPIGVYLSTHSGGWTLGGGLENWDAVEGQNVLDWGCAVVRPDYRLAPEHKFPAAIEDCYAALTYLGRTGASMGFDTARIGIGGGCAGANIATAVTLMARDAGEQLPAVQFLWSACFDMRQNYESYYECADGYGLRKADDEFAKSCYLRSEEDKWDWRASPILAETLKGAPPALFWVGEWEILRDETHLYANRMRDAGCAVHFFEGEQQGHGFLYINRDTKHARETLPKINDIMRSYIGPESAKT